MNTSSFAKVLRVVFRGGAGLVCASLLWSVLIPQNGDLFMRLLFGWLSSAWVVFPIGAALAWVLPQYVGTRSFLTSVGIGLLIGLVASLVLTTGLWLWFNHRELMGLITNRHSQRIWQL